MKSRRRVSFFRIFSFFFLIACLTGCQQKILLPVMNQETGYERALNAYLKGDFRQARHLASLVKKESGDYLSAQRLIKKINVLSHQLAKKYMEIGDLYEKAGIIPKAEDVYERALTVNPGNPVAKKKRNRLPLREKEKFIEIKRKPEAAPKKVTRRPDLQALYDKGMELYKKGDYSRAIDKFHAVLKVDPAFKDTTEVLVAVNKERTKFIRSHLRQGIHYYQQEKLREAIMEWDRVLAKDPGNATARNYKRKANAIIKKLKEISKGEKR